MTSPSTTHVGTHVHRCLVRRRSRWWTLAIVAGAMLCAGPSNAAAQSPEAVRTIEQLSGDLYRWRSGERHSVFLVTSSGILVGDTLDSDSARWLRSELNSRFPDLAVRYVVLSHHHYERASGASVFDSTATVVGHKSFNRALRLSRHIPSQELLNLDTNRSGFYELSELSAVPNGAVIAARDADGDGRVTLAELYGDVSALDVRREMPRHVQLGGRTVELVYPGRLHTEDSAVVFFPAERVVFAADAPALTTTPFAFGLDRPRDVLQWLRVVGRLGFDTLLVGNGEVIPRADVVSLRDYLETLVDEVGHGYAAGDTLDEIRARPVPSRHMDSPHYAGRVSQIESVYRNVSLRSLEVSGTVMASYSGRVNTYCAEYDTCSSGGVVPTGSGTLTYSIGRHFSIGSEFTYSRQWWSSRTLGTVFAEEHVYRPTRVAALAGYRFSTRGAFSYRVVGGLSYTFERLQGSDRVPNRLAPIGGRHAFADRRSSAGLVGGLDFGRSLGRGISVVLPLRMTYTFAGSADRWPQQLEMRAGAGLRLTLYNRVQ